MPSNFIASEIPDVLVIEPKIFEDNRGFFMETYKETEFAEKGIPSLVQENHSMSSEGVLRGLHYQLPPHAQGKLVRVVAGKIYDVAVDIRKGSKYYGKWVGMELSAENKKMLWVPEGFAHGFLTLEDGTEVVYKTSSEYAPEAERSIIWNDPSLAIDWPTKQPTLAAKDASAPALKNADNSFTYLGGEK